MAANGTARNEDNRKRLAATAVLGALLASLAIGLSMAGASKVVLSSFGEKGTLGGQFEGLRQVAVNSTGASAADPGDLYAIESTNNRIQRLDGDGGFIAAWGKDVDTGGGAGVEECTVAASCKAADPGSAEGELSNPRSIAVNQDTGEVYVYEQGNFRVQQFSADGSFVRAWGWGVDDGSAAFQVCTSTCQAGIPGANGGQFANSNGWIALDGSGGVYVTDAANNRVQKFTATGSFVRAWGWDVVPPGKPGNVPGTNEQVKVEVSGATGGTFGLSWGSAVSGNAFTGPIAYNAPATGPGSVQAVLEALAAIDPGDVEVSGAPGGPWTITFTGKYVDIDQAVVSNALALTGPNPQLKITTLVEGSSGPEICTSTVAGDCKAGVGPLESSLRDGQFSASVLPVAADSAGNSYVVNRNLSTGQNAVQKFDPAGNFVARLAVSASAWEGIAVDQTNDHVYVVELVTGSSDRIIEEFDPAGTLLDTHIPSGIGPIDLNTSAAGPFAGRLYSASTTRVDVLEEVPAPTISIDPAAGVTATTADLSGTVAPNGNPSSYRFEYRVSGTPTWRRAFYPNIELGDGTGAGEPEECPEGNPPSCEVTMQLSGLLPATGYEARISATNDFGVFAASDPVSFITAPAPPLVDVATTTAGKTTATLRGSVNPRGSAITECRFEWGPTDSYGGSSPCESLPDGSNSPELVAATLSGLKANTTYRYRLVAANAAGEAEGADRSFETSLLPSGRAYEMVSPPNKNGGHVIIDTQRTRPATGLAPGQDMALSFSSLSAFAGAEGTSIAVDYLAVRDEAAGRWKTHAITPTQDAGPIESGAKDKRYLGEFSPDLSTGVTLVTASRNPLTADSELVKRVSNLYLRRDLRDPAGGAYELISACPRCAAEEAPIPTDNFYLGSQFAGASDDFGVVAFESSKNLTADAGGSSQKLYEWREGDVSLTGRVPAGGDRCDDEAAPACVAAERSEGVRNGQEVQRIAPADSVSSNGSRVFFNAGTPNQVYARINGSATVRISASEREAPDATEKATLWAFTPDFSHAFFTTGERLLDSDEDDCVDLYRYSYAPLGPDGLPDPSASHLVRLSIDSEPDDGACEATLGAIGVSDTGDTAYFMASGQLVTGGRLLAGQYAYIYRWQDGAPLRFIGATGVGGAEINQNLNGNEHFSNRVSADGSRMLFTSFGGEGLTGYQHADCDVSSYGHSCREAYVYDAEANGGEGQLTCVSCDADGTPGVPFNATVSYDTQQLSSLAERGGHLSNPISADGRFVYFDTLERMVPNDTNGARDVYQYDTHSGQLALISSGESAAASYFLDASPDGRDVFFATAERLSAWDYDTSYDIYDARVGGGLPEPPLPAQECEGDSCQPPPIALSDPTPTSSGFLGVGNVQSRQRQVQRCPSGKRAVRRGGKTRCVKKRRGGKPRKAKRNRKQRRISHHNRRAGR